MSKVAVIFHSADFDGIFCREIANKFLTKSQIETKLIGWDFGDPPLKMSDLSDCSKIIVMDLPLDKTFGLAGPPNLNTEKERELVNEKLVWIDHHKSAIDSHPKEIPGYRIEGVAACRLTWQWFALHSGGVAYPEGGFGTLPPKQAFIDRQVLEPLAVRLAGEYDVWDKRDLRTEVFQCGLKSRQLDHSWWKALLSIRDEECLNGPEHWVNTLLEAGEIVRYVQTQEYEKVIQQQGFTLKFQDVTFLACMSHELDIRSQLFEAGIKPYHDALLGFTFTGRDWRVSMYHISGRPTQPDILSIAKSFGGGGHPGACGFRGEYLPFSLATTRHSSTDGPLATCADAQPDPVQTACSESPPPGSPS